MPIKWRGEGSAAAGFEGFTAEDCVPCWMRERCRRVGRSLRLEGRLRAMAIDPMSTEGSPGEGAEVPLVEFMVCVDGHATCVVDAHGVVWRSVGRENRL